MSIDTVQSDSELIARYVRDGSHDAFGELVWRHIDMVYATALRQVHAGGGENVMQVGHWLEEAGLKFSQAKRLPQGKAPGSTARTFSIHVAAALHQAKFHLPVIGLIAQKIVARGFAFDEADLLHFAADGQVIVICAKKTGADRIDNAKGFEANFSGDAAIAGFEKPAAGFFFSGFYEGLIHPA